MQNYSQLNHQNAKVHKIRRIFLLSFRKNKVKSYGAVEY